MIHSLSDHAQRADAHTLDGWAPPPGPALSLRQPETTDNMTSPTPTVTPVKRVRRTKAELADARAAILLQRAREATFAADAADFFAKDAADENDVVRPYYEFAANLARIEATRRAKELTNG